MGEGASFDHFNHSQIASSFHFPGHSPTDYFSHPAESLAASIAKPTPEDIQTVLRLLPTETPARGVAGDSTHSFTVGAFSKGGRVGVRANTRSFPAVTQMLTRFVRSRDPNRVFGAIACFTNLEADFHSDVNNDARFHNWIVPLSRFAQGGIWVEQEGGPVTKFARGRHRPGAVLDVGAGPVELPSHCLHCVLPWTGTRCVLVAFVPASLDRLKPTDKTFMSTMGFYMPHAGVVPQPCVSTPDAKTGTDGLGPGPSSSVGVPASLPDPRAPPSSSVKPFALELFCGTAGVSAALMRRGFEVLGIDHMLRPRKVKAPAVRVDISDPAQQHVIMQEVRRAHCVFLAPPCGTSSRARSIPLTGRGPKPRPLRSPAFPEGLRKLTGVAAARVASANRLYRFAADIFSFCCKAGKICIIENPTNSLMWDTRWFRAVVHLGHWNSHHACMYGSARDKKTSLLSTHPLPSMQLLCDGQHSHLPWGRRKNGTSWAFATAAEAAYPKGFCSALAKDICDIMTAGGWDLHDSVPSHTALAAQAAQRQARRDAPHHGPSEYLSRVTITVPRDVSVPATIPDNPPESLKGIPVGSKLLQCQDVQKGGAILKETTFGIFRTPDAFVTEALKMKHPFEVPTELDASNIQAMANILSSGIDGTQKFRDGVLRHYEHRAACLEKAEQELKDSMHPEVRVIMQDKRLLLLAEVLRDAGVDDKYLIEDLTQGFRITGELRPSGLFPRILRPAALTQDDLRATAKWSKHVVADSCRRASKDSEVARSVWRETMEQRDKHWLRGPFSFEQMDEKYNGTWIASKRFGVVQGEKTRAVDDLSEFLVNASVTETDKVILDAVDNIVATARFLVGSTCDGKDRFRLPAKGGATFTGHLHEDFRSRGSLLSLLGRALDLKSAYKQLARHPEDSWATVLAVLCPDDDKVYFFEAVALPFGGVSAVTGFNRAARSLKLAMSRLLWLINTSYYDDFCQMEVAGLETSAASAAERFLALLGWEIARGDKLKSFSPSFNILGVTISFERSAQGVIEVSNKQGRVPDLWRLLEQMESDPGLRLDTLASFRGRMLFATSHVFGKCAQICTQLIGQALKAARPEEARDHVLKAARLALQVLSEAGPRQVLRWGEAPPVLVFTDGACEDDGALTTHGAVLMDPATGVQEFFGDRVPDHLVQRWKGQGLKQLVFFAELLPVAVAKATWAHVLRNRLCIFFLDNEAARACLIRSFTPVVNATSILMDVAVQDVASHALNWYSRVPTKSNIADDASRLEFGRYANLFRMVQPVYASIT